MDWLKAQKLHVAAQRAEFLSRIRTTTATTESRLRLLDVGALAPNYRQHDSWICWRGIDLHARDPAVEELDFFDLEPGQAACDLLALSLVLNFVPEPRRRGDMLLKAGRHLPLGGLAFVVMPLACIQRSRYCDQATFMAALQYAGFKVLQTSTTKLLARYIVEKVADGPQEDMALPLALQRRTEVNPGPQRNNFHMLFGSGPREPAEAKKGSDTRSPTPTKSKAKRRKRE